MNRFRTLRSAGPATLLAALALAGPTTAAAQVGHPPESSPYRDIRYGGYLNVFGGRFGGSGGAIGVAPHDGRTVGLRWNFLGNRPVQIGLGFASGTMSRLIQEPTRSPETRISGPVDQQVIWTDVVLQFNLTGGKRWRGLAPFTGVATGLAFTEKTSEDSTGFRMGNKFYLAPMAGTRLFVSDRLYLQLEGRYVFWQVKYPAGFRNPQDPTGTPLLPDDALAEWTVSPWVQIGLGWAISLPF